MHLGNYQHHRIRQYIATCYTTSQLLLLFSIITFCSWSNSCELGFYFFLSCLVLEAGNKLLQTCIHSSAHLIHNKTHFIRINLRSFKTIPNVEQPIQGIRPFNEKHIHNPVCNWIYKANYYWKMFRKFCTLNWSRNFNIDSVKMLSKHFIN